MEPKIFIGSSRENERLAVTLQGLLNPHMSAIVWSQTVFLANYGNLDNLIKATGEFDFACFLGAPEDTVISRGSTQGAPRDNVLFEFGLFLGALGRDRVFLVQPRSNSGKIPSDLAGIAFFSHKEIDEHNPEMAALAPTALEITNYVKRIGKRTVLKPTGSSTLRRYSPVLERGKIDRISNLADAALHYAKKRVGYNQSIKEHLIKKEVIPELYYYITEEGAKYWMDMMSDPKYRFHNNSAKLINLFARLLPDKIFSQDGEVDLDFISLGSGDGQKDHALLDELAKNSRASITYYPIDISDKLLVECIRNVFTGNLDHVGVRTKAVIGDFCELATLRAVYEERPAPNVFSILGNTFGNSDEGRILGALRASMYSGDYLIVEINCSPEEVTSSSSFLNSPFRIEYACLPLRMLGLKVDLNNVVVRETKTKSVFKSATSAETLYPRLEVDGVVLKQVPLAYDHRYAFDEFQKEIEHFLDVKIIEAHRIENAGIILAAKR
jgi:Predicted nucleotide-binding protein containing TIR-like domain/Histidine-specific methyltransferase, SAM-dependent